jgi:hypothetical protein
MPFETANTRMDLVPDYGTVRYVTASVLSYPIHYMRVYTRL